MVCLIFVHFQNWDTPKKTHDLIINAKAILVEGSLWSYLTLA